MLAERRAKWCHEYVDARKNAWKTLCDMKEDNFDSAFAVDAFHRYGVRMSGRKIAKEVLEERMKSDPLLAGRVLLNGEFGVEKNLEEALAQFSRSRDPRARFYEGRMFFRGEGVKMDIPRAVRLFHEAAAGYFLLFEGFGVLTLFLRKCAGCYFCPCSTLHERALRRGTGSAQSCNAVRAGCSSFRGHQGRKPRVFLLSFEVSASS